mgnify:CR=1 FL=1
MIRGPVRPDVNTLTMILAAIPMAVVHITIRKRPRSDSLTLVVRKSANVIPAILCGKHTFTMPLAFQPRSFVLIAILENKRASALPLALDELALEEYEILLEDQAIPLEDKAIAIFQTNTERTLNGVWDEWVQKSYQSLSKLSPGRYNKTELTEEYVDDIY